MVGLAGCARPVFPEPFAQQKVYVQLANDEQGSGGDIRTDLGITFMEGVATYKSGDVSQTQTEQYNITNVTAAGFTLVYDIAFSPAPSPELARAKGEVAVRYGEKTVTNLPGGYRLSVQTQ